MKPVKVLFIMYSMDIGGVQSGIMNFVKVISPDDAQIDLMLQCEEKGFHEKEFLKYGKIYRIPIKTANSKIANLFYLFYNNIYFRKNLEIFLKQNKYDVVHCKSLDYCPAAVEAAKKAGVPVRITQSHVDKPKRLNPVTKIYYWLAARRIERAATVKLAVSEQAAEFLYGKYGGTVIKTQR